MNLVSFHSKTKIWLHSWSLWNFSKNLKMNLNPSLIDWDSLILALNSFYSKLNSFSIFVTYQIFFPVKLISRKKVNFILWGEAKLRKISSIVLHCQSLENDQVCHQFQTLVEAMVLLTTLQDLLLVLLKNYDDGVFFELLPNQKCRHKYNFEPWHPIGPWKDLFTLRISCLFAIWVSGTRCIPWGQKAML